MSVGYVSIFSSLFAVLSLVGGRSSSIGGVFACIPVAAHAQGRSADTSLITWKNGNDLRWSDFRGPVDQSSRYAAECVSYWHPVFYKRNDSLFCRIETVFDKKESWTRGTRADSFGLKHEQTHFDITELFARFIRKDLAGVAKTQSDVLFTLKKWTATCAETQADYDRETRHSLDTQSQADWNKRIQTRLREMESASNKEIYLGTAVGVELY